MTVKETPETAYDTTVTVRANGQVEVNGFLVAEVTVGSARLGGVEVFDRDTLVASLTVDRIAHELLETLQQTIGALGAGGAVRAKANAGWRLPRNGKDPKFVCATTGKGDDVVDGLVDGLLDVTVPYPPQGPGVGGGGPDDAIPPISPRHDFRYREGYALGRHLRVMTAHLDRALDEAVDASV